MKKASRFAALVISTVLAVSASAAVTVTANAAPQTKASSSAAIESISRDYLTKNAWEIRSVADQKGQQVNPYKVFGTAYKLSHVVRFKDEAGKSTFCVYVGAGKGNDPKGTFSYNKTTGKLFLNYDNGFAAMAYAGFDAQGNVIIKMPVMIGSEIFSLELGVC